MKRFEIIETTADIGLRFYGSDECELIRNALYGFYYLTLDKVDIDFSMFKKLGEFEIREKLMEKLIFKLFEETIFQLFTKNRLMDLKDLTNGILCLNLYKNDFFIEMEIKAVTKHNFIIKKVDSSYVGEVIFDI